MCLQYHLFLASMGFVLLADDAYGFMLAWETMALSSYFLVTTQHRIPEIRSAGFLYLLIAHIGAIAILLSFGVLQGGSWQFTFDAMRGARLDPVWAAIAFLLALFGFGAKAGLVPMHVWLPEAHPAAPSPVSALMSGVMLKTALYGLLRVTFDLLGEPLWWWGLMPLALGLFTALYGVIFGPPLAGRDPLVKATATLGLALILLGIMDLVWSDKARSMILPTSNHGFEVSAVFVNWTEVIAVGFALAVMTVTALFLRFTKTGTAMRALANDREITATLGVPVRRVEAAAWLGSGLVSGASGLLLANLVGLDAATLTFLVISSLAATLIGRLRSITVTFIAGIGIGLVNALVTPIVSISQYRDMTPFVLATIALLVLSGRRGSALAGRAG